MVEPVLGLMDSRCPRFQANLVVSRWGRINNSSRCEEQWLWHFQTKTVKETSSANLTRTAKEVMPIKSISSNSFSKSRSSLHTTSASTKEEALAQDHPTVTTTEVVETTTNSFWRAKRSSMLLPPERKASRL